ncbi:MAG: type II toxin-antitoxin system VapC family toxin [Pirellulales bacterium]
MAHLLDTGILLRLVDQRDPLHERVVQAVAALAQQNEELFTTTQNIAEFWNVATRPVSANGLGLTGANVVELLQSIIEPTCGILIEAELLYSEFKRLGQKYGFGGKQAHDARLIAMTLCWGIETILTLNERDFRPYRAEGIVIETPTPQANAT